MRLGYACQEVYPRTVEALGLALAVGGGGVRAYLGDGPLGDIAGASPRGAKDWGEPLLSLVTPIKHLAEGRDAATAAMLG